MAASLKGFTVYLTAKQRAMLDELGELQDRSATAVAARFIKRGIRRHEERKKLREARTCPR